MNVLQLKKIGYLTLEQKPVPTVKSDEVLVKISHCAICRTDAKMWERGQRDLVLPRILGHEFCGIVENTGQHVVVWPGKACGHCEQCRRGAENLCSKMEILGFHKDGGFAEYIAVPKSSLIPVPADLPGDLACLAEPIACTINALEQADIKKRNKVLIYGAGPIGLMMAMAVKAYKAFPFIIDINSERLKQSEDFQKQIKIQGFDKYSSSKFDIAINAAPYFDTFLEGLTKLIDGGCFCIFSGFTDDSSASASVINEIHYRQLKVTGAYGCKHSHINKALKILLDYKDHVELLIEDHIKLEQVTSVMPKILAGKAFKFIICFNKS
ncbi:Alcohol dehydrogenase [Candidatus Magnetomoraceae bacterium gMMP-15]